MSVAGTNGESGRRLSRRTFVRGMAAGAVGASLGWRPRDARAQAARVDQAVLSGSEFDLRIGEVAANITGRSTRQRGIACGQRG